MRNFGVDFPHGFLYVTRDLDSHVSFGKATGRLQPPSGPVVASLHKRDAEDRYSAIRQAGLLTTIPVLLAASPIIGFLIGRFIDRKLNTEPVFGIVFLVFGFIAGAVQVTRVVRLAGKDVHKPGREKKDDSRGA
jgi:F0F1-type ATP synthase assembly protein I